MSASDQAGAEQQWDRMGKVLDALVADTRDGLRLSGLKPFPYWLVAVTSLTDNIGGLPLQKQRDWLVQFNVAAVIRLAQNPQEPPE